MENQRSKLELQINSPQLLELASDIQLLVNPNMVHTSAIPSGIQKEQNIVSSHLKRSIGSSPPSGTNIMVIYMYFLYAIKSQTHNFIYVGLTSNLSARIERHNNGYERTTKPYRPFRLIYHEECPDEFRQEFERSTGNQVQVKENSTG
jgi:putative endonuclease